MDFPVLYDIIDAVIQITIVNPPVRLPPPMTRAEVAAQHLYADDCMTTRDGIAMTCETAFQQDLNRAYAFEERKRNGTRN